ncbi:MAG: Gfo/Idh/MocA family oxidoreductase [Victivallaceae bacterium]
MKKIKTSVIGLGHAAEVFHMPGLSRFDDIELSICDSNQERLTTVGAKFGIPSNRHYLNYKEMLKNEEPEAVLVLLPQYKDLRSTAHANYNPEIYLNIVKDVISQEKAVMVEKPLAMTLEHAQELANAARKAGVISMVSVNRRFNPLVQYCRKEVLKCSPILNVNCNFYKGFGPKMAFKGCIEWLTGDMIHALDLMRYLIGGEIIEFYPSLAKTADDEEVSAFYALAAVSNGATGIFSSNIRVGGRVQEWQIHGDGISCYIRESFTPYDQKETGMHTDAVIIRRDQKDVEMIKDIDLVPNEFAVYAGFTAADRYFIDCVKSGTMPHCSFEDGKNTVYYCNKIITSRLKSIKLR